MYYRKVYLQDLCANPLAKMCGVLQRSKSAHKSDAPVSQSQPAKDPVHGSDGEDVD